MSDNSEHNLSQKIAVNPVTAVQVTAGVLSIASSIKSLFFDKNSNAIKQRLDQLIKQNREIIHLLTQVLDVLNDLGVVVQRAVREEFQRNTTRQLNSNFTSVLETFLAEVEDPSATDEAVERYSGFIRDIKSLSRQLARYDDFGFGLFDSVGLGMVMEFWIEMRIGTHAAFIRQAAKTYVDYFTAVLRPELEGSVGSQLAKANAQSKRLDRILTDADAIVAQAKGVIVARRVKIDKKGRTSYYADIQETLIGSRATGYSSRSEYVNQFSETEDRGGGGPPGGGPPRMDLKMKQDPIDSGDTSPQGRANYFNAVRSVYMSLTQELPALVNAAQSAQLYLDVARTHATTV